MMLELDPLGYGQQLIETDCVTRLIECSFAHESSSLCISSLHCLSILVQHTEAETQIDEAEVYTASIVFWRPNSTV